MGAATHLLFIVMYQRTRNKILTTATVMFLAGTYTCHAQKGDRTFSPKLLVYENLNNNEVLKHFKTRFTQLDELLKNKVTVASPTTTLGFVSQQSLDYTDSLFKAKTAHEALALKRHTGLEITGQAYGRPDEALKNEDEEDNVSIYKVKAQAELGWNIINSKFYKGKDKEEKIFLANELARLQQRKRMTSDIYDKASEKITDEYNRYIGITIAHRLANLDIMNEAYQFMLEKDRISNDKMLKVMNDKMEAEYDLSILCASKDVDNKPIYEITATRIDVDTTALFNYIKKRSMDSRIAMVKEQIADNESKLTNYLSTTRLTPFVRWSTYLTSNNAISNNVDVGVRFTFPLYDESGRKKKALATEKEIIRQSRSTDVETAKMECENLVKKINNINRAIETEAFHIKQMAKYVDIRQIAYQNQKNGYNYIMRMEEYTGYLESMERLYKLMLNRAIAVIGIQKSAGLNYNDKKIFVETQL